MVKSNGIYAPQNYVGAVTGIYYCFKHNEHPADEIQYLLAMNEYELWDYPLTEIDHIVENNLNVVLVDCSHYEDDVYVSEYRWFEVPEDFNDEDDDEDYTPSATNGDYSPSNPWDAPGMSIKDFI
jgi:hypothetical protein